MQKTGLGNSPSPNQEPPNPGEIGETITVAGRELTRVGLGEAAKDAHKVMLTPKGNAEAMEAEVDPEAKARADRLTPEFLKQKAKEEAKAAKAAKRELIADGVRAELAEKLSDQILEARQAGNTTLAEQLKDTLGKLLHEVAPKRVREPKPPDPVLTRLREKLGLQRIKGTKIPWGGFKWQFAPPPPMTDHWVAQAVEAGLGTFSALRVAAACVGIDGTPIYKVFNIALTGEFEPSSGGPTVEVRYFLKRCEACGDRVEIDATDCECGSHLDPFDMPVDLRVQCAERLHTFFLKEFGPYEQLTDLYNLLRAEMPDRVEDREQLYPFLKASPGSSRKTDTTPSGDEQSSD